MTNYLQALYEQIPQFTCKEGCADCCGPVLFSKSEWESIEDKRKATSTKCPYASSVGCDIYAQRPLICRLYGASSHPTLRCPHGCGPSLPLDLRTTRQIFVDYYARIEE